MMKLFPRLRGWRRPTPKARAARLPLELEALDVRILPSATASLQPNGVLAIVADANPDNVQVSLNSPDNSVLVTDSGTPVGTFLSCIFFGASEGVASNMKAANIGAGQLADAVPYVVTVIGLALATRRIGLRHLRRGGRPTTTTGPAAREDAPATEGV